MKHYFATILVVLTGAALLRAATAAAGEAAIADHLEDSIQAARETAGPECNLFPGWLIDLSAGYSMSRGNSDTQNLLARAAAMKKFADVWEFVGQGEYAWGKIKDRDTGEYDETADRGQLSVQGNLFLIEDGFLYGRSEISYDRIKELDRRLDSGAGAGYNLWRREISFAAVEAGATYIDSKYENARDDHGLYLRLAQNGAFRINERVTFLESIEYKPKFADFNEYLLTAEAALRVSLMEKVFFQLTVTNRYDNNAPDNVERNDLSMIGSLGISL